MLHRITKLMHMCHRGMTGFKIFIMHTCISEEEKTKMRDENACPDTKIYYANVYTRWKKHKDAFRGCMPV